MGQVIGMLNTGATWCYQKMYYKNVLNGQGIGNITDEKAVVEEKQIVEGKTEEELKSEGFLNSLNQAHTHNVDGTEVDYTGKCWVEDTNNINSRYPIFSYQADLN